MEDDARGVADVLDPAETVAGVDGVRRVVKKARQVWLVSDPEALAPCRLTKRAARALLDRVAAGGEVAGPDGVRPVMVTARVEGPDAVIRTLEWMGDASRMGRPDRSCGRHSVVRGRRSDADALCLVLCALLACFGADRSRAAAAKPVPQISGSGLRFSEVQEASVSCGRRRSRLVRDRDIRWYVSRSRRALDDLENVVAYRSADDVSGSPDVVLYARCLGDRTEVELDMGVDLGDDVVTDGDLRTKRVLVRFVPRNRLPVVFRGRARSGRSSGPRPAARVPARSGRGRLGRRADRFPARYRGVR